MEKKILDNLIAVATKSSDKSVIYKALVRLRTDLVVDKKGIQQFCDAGGIAPLVRLLSKPYEKILEVALSILGNCCTEKECCKQAIAFGVVPPLLTILKSIPNPRVQCRVCRLLGNLARESNEKLCTLAKGIGVTMASVIGDSTDAGTQCMAVRAIRLLWNEMPFYEEFVRSEGVDKILGILLSSMMIKEDVADTTKSITEQSAYEKGRVEFMEEYIPSFELRNSKGFDMEIMKKFKAKVEKFKIPESQSQQERDLFAELLKCLAAVTKMTSSRIVYPFYRNIDSSSCITFCANADSPYRAQALKILSNLSKTCMKNILNEADAVTTACRLITAQDLVTPLDESEERHCVCVICFLADDACNRAKIRQSGAFKRLLQMAKDTTSDSLLIMILIGLKHFRYDNVSIELMIRIGLVQMLIKLLELNTKGYSVTHNAAVLKKNDVKKSLRDKDDDDDDDEIDSANVKRAKVDYGPNRLIPRSTDSPPASTSSASIVVTPNSSPCSSISQSPRCLSPANTKGGFYDDIDDYSPVVSDIEEDLSEDNAKGSVEHAKQGASYDLLQQILNENEQSTTKSVLEDENLMEADEPEEEDGEKEPSAIDMSEKKKIIQLILGILCSAAYRLKHVQCELSLCTPEVLDTLVKTCKVLYRRRAGETSWDAGGAPLVLSHIISETKNFVPLLKRDFIFRIYEMAQPTVEHENCSLCTDLKQVGAGLLNLLTGMAESGYGRGEMIHLLLKEDKGMCKQVSIISALIIKDPKILNTLLLKHGGLYTIIELIVNKSEQLSNEAALGLTALSKQLKIKIPKYDSTRLCDENVVLTTACDSEVEAGDSDYVTFVSGSPETDANEDESSRIRFSEATLTQVSDVFNRMFNSDFKESKEKEVIMKNQSIEGIKYFLECVERYSKQKPLRRPVRPADKSSTDDDTTASNAKPSSTIIMAVLEAYDICHVYLLTELEKDIYNMIIYLLDADNLLDIFLFSMKHHKQELTELSINYYLTSNLAGDVKVRIFRDADDSDYYKEWNELILDTIVYTCQNLIT